MCVCVYIRVYAISSAQLNVFSLIVIVKICVIWPVNIQSTVGTICTTFSIHKMHSAHMVYLWVLHNSHSKQ
jgi:hypothetical protein